MRGAKAGTPFEEAEASRPKWCGAPSSLRIVVQALFQLKLHLCLKGKVKDHENHATTHVVRNHWLLP
jgi:hypothetical protein